MAFLALLIGGAIALLLLFKLLGTLTSILHTVQGNKNTARVEKQNLPLIVDASTNMTEKIAQAHALLQKGAITQSEFEQLKKKILENG